MSELVQKRLPPGYFFYCSSTFKWQQQGVSGR